jgi:DNA polymerase (family 10)
VKFRKIVESCIYSSDLEIMKEFYVNKMVDKDIRMGVQKGVKLVIDSDAHHYIHFAFLTFGIGQARRGWAKQSDILNTLSSSFLYNIAS